MLSGLAHEHAKDKDLAAMASMTSSGNHEYIVCQYKNNFCFNKRDNNLSKHD
jgi:hypothetical protein